MLHFGPIYLVDMIFINFPSSMPVAVPFINFFRKYIAAIIIPKTTASADNIFTSDEKKSTVPI
jgi:hypothetical protein